MKQLHRIKNIWHLQEYDVGIQRKEYTDMEEKLVNILNQMAEYLNISQMKKLQEVLLKNLAQPETTKVETTNDTYLQMFLDAKKIEGCSERTLQYYRVTVEKMFQMLKTPVRKITTEEIRTYLSE